MTHSAPQKQSATAGSVSGLAAWARAHRARLIPGTIAVVLIGVLAALLAYLQPLTWRYYTDGSTVRRLAKDVEPRPVLWEDGRLMPCQANLPADLSEPFVLADGVTMLFTAGGAAGNANLFSTRWDGRAWSDPKPLQALNSLFNERGPVVSPDGQFLFFSSDRPGGLGGYDIWVARWDGVTWAWPANLGFMINTKFDESGPAVSPFDGRLFFASNRAKQRLTEEEDLLPVKALREKFKKADSDLYAADQVPADAAINREIERMQSQLYSLRTGALSDPTVMSKLGGSAETEAAVERALAYLAKAQTTNGNWTVGGHDSAATGFALLTFLGRGIKPGDGSPYGTVVANALFWMINHAQLNGDMRVGGNMYDQGVATLALTEAYGLTKDDKLKEPVQAAVNFIVDAQHEDGGWRYNPKEVGDLSVSSWQIMALKSAELSGLMISETCLAKARAWLREKMGHGPNKGIYSYTADDGGGQPGMQAAGFFCSQLLGISPNTVRARDSVTSLTTHGFDPAKASIYYWYNAVLGSYQYQGVFWQEWNKRLIEHYLPAQRRDGEFAGSWDPAGHAMGESMGRTIVTAMFTLSLEVYYRYTPLYGLGFDPQSHTNGADGWDADRIAKVPVYRRARPVDGLNSSAEERRPTFTRRGDFVYFSSNRGEGLGGHDIYRARVNQAKEGAPENLGPEINSKADEMSPALRLAGFQLLYASNREGSKPGAPRLYSSTSRYVRAVHDYRQTRGMMDQLRMARGRLILLVVALCSTLLFVRSLRRSMSEARVGAEALLDASQRVDAKTAAGRRRRRAGNVLAWVGLSLSLLGLVGLLGSIVLALRSSVWCRYTDDISIVKQAVDVKPRPVVWDFPATLGRQFTGLVDRASLNLTPDGASLLASQTSASTGKVEVMTSSWDGYEWSGLSSLTNLNGELSEQDAVITRDGSRIFFASDRPGGLGGLDIWTAVRSKDQWVCVTNLGPSVNSAANEVAPAPSPDGARLLFSSDRTARKQKDFDIFSTDLTAVSAEVAVAEGTGTVAFAYSLLKPSVAVPVDTLNTPFNELNCSYTERGDWLTFASDRKRGRGGFDAYSARVLKQLVGRGLNLGSEINTTADEESTGYGMDGFQLVFNSSRGAESSGMRPFAVTATEVVGKWDLSRWFSLGDLLHSLRWWILLGLVALIGIIYILTHLKDITSLRAKCIMASVLVHLILLLLTAMWVISKEVMDSRAARKQEMSLSIDTLAQEKLALDVREEVVELPDAKASIVAEQADEALPVPNFNPVQRAVQTIVARSVAESFVAESAPSAGTPQSREASEAKMPDMPDLQAPKLDVALRVESPIVTVADAKVAEAFKPQVNVPSVSTTRVDVVMPTAKPVLAVAGVSAVGQTNKVTDTAASLIRDTGGSTPVASTGGDVSTGLTALEGPGMSVSALLAGGTGNRIAMDFPGKLDVPGGGGKQISPYKLRQEAKENPSYLEGLGGSDATQGAVGKALDWFARHQEPDGRWAIAKYGGQAGHDVAATGLALLCYLGWGVKHNEAGMYQAPAAKAVAWLVSQVQTNGSVIGVTGIDMYDQGIAAIALTEAYAMTKDKALEATVSNMVQFIVNAQHMEGGGWRYQPGQPGDTSVFGWQCMAVMSAKMSGLDVPTNTLALADKWLTSVGGGERGGFYGYADKNPSQGMAAEGMFCRQILGALPDEPRMMESAGYLTTRLPDAATVDLYYWYYATLALYQHRGEAWELWNARLKTVLPPLQAKTGDEDGSWAPAGPQGDRMGRVVATALSTLSLEVYYRYLPFAHTKGVAVQAAQGAAAKKKTKAP
jgi:Tol biopolymer transport system component